MGRNEVVRHAIVVHVLDEVVDPCKRNGRTAVKGVIQCCSSVRQPPAAGENRTIGAVETQRKAKI